MKERHPLAHYFRTQARADDRAGAPLGIRGMLSSASKLGPPELVRTLLRSLEATCCALRADGLTVASPVCRSRCYAWKTSEGRTTLERAEKNELIWERPDRVLLMCGAIREAKVYWFRFNDIGDFTTPDDIHASIEIARTLQDVHFWVYTRCWQYEELLDPVLELSKLPNVDVLFSWDRSMPDLPVVDGIPIAWLADSDFDEPPRPVDVIFRATAERDRDEDRRRHDERRRVDLALPVLHHRNVKQMRSMAGSPVCPHQTGFPLSRANKDCISCKLCMPKARARQRGNGPSFQ